MSIGIKYPPRRHGSTSHDTTVPTRVDGVIPVAQIPTTLDGMTLTGTTTVSILQNTKARITAEGGLAIRLTNKSGGASVQGVVVTPSAAVANAVTRIIKDVPNPIGVFYESGIADGAEAWIVVAGIADVYFTGNTTLGHIARGYLTTDGASYVIGQALSEAVPGSPFSADKHFYEIGHLLESRTGEGLAKTVLHFN